MLRPSDKIYKSDDNNVTLMMKVMYNFPFLKLIIVLIHNYL